VTGGPPRGTGKLSIVFDARKHAEQSKRAREAVAEIQQSTDSGPASSDVKNVLPHGEENRTKPKHPEQSIWAGEPGPLSTGSEASADGCLGLSVERRSTDWRLKWKRNAVANATSGRLTITDGGIQKHLDLDVSELQDGSIVYIPDSEDFVIRLEIVNPESPTPVTESIRLVTKAQPRPWLSAEIGRGRPGSNRVARSDAAWATDTSMTTRGVAEQAPIVRSLLRTARSEAASAALVPSNLAGPGGKVEPAALISRKDPAYPTFANGSPISGRVEVQFRISPEGKVYDAKTVKGPAILARAAIEALEMWRYEPARLYGAPVDSQASTNFDFKFD
jgi:TonB family protein